MGERIRRALMVVMVVVAVSTAALPGGPTGAGTGAAPTRGAVRADVVGDSLVTQASIDLEAQLRASGVVAEVAHRPAQDLGSGFVADRLGAVEDRPVADVLVLATAANDVLRGHDLTLLRGPEVAGDSFSVLLDRTLDRFGDRCVVVVNAREEIAPVYHPEQARIVNGLLRRAAGRHPNLVVVDWAAISRDLPGEWFADDQLHFGPDPAAPAEGSGSAREYAAAIVAGIDTCADRAADAGPS